MFWKRTKEGQTEPVAPQIPKPPTAQAPGGGLDLSPWMGGDNPESGLDHAKRAKARGRYEVARAFQIPGVEWYAKNVVGGKPMPGETAEDRQRFREYLEDYRAEVENLRLAANDRDALLALLRAAPEGLTRQELEARHKLECSIKLGVMLNQLEKGGWISREGEGKKQVIRAAKTAVPSDAEYLRKDHQ